MPERVASIVIVGGGSAGWLTAGVLAARHGSTTPSRMSITLVESPSVPTIGVGEGTWPSMRDTLRKMGVSESEFIRECDASFKQGSRFAGWVTGEDGEHYYHPFSAPQGYGQVNLVEVWQSRHAERPFADVVSFQPRLCEAGKAPKQAATPEFAAVANYAYHLDAVKFAQFLQRHCTEKLGVRHVIDHVSGVATGDNGYITGVQTAGSGTLAGDLFIDCTGFSALLLGSHYGVRLRSLGDVLFCDTALAVQAPYPAEDGMIASCTHATARSAGWIWDIGLPTRRGVGYVYSSAHCSPEQAERTLLDYVAGIAGDAAADAATPRKLSIDPGHRERFWHKNCVAVGLAAGFIEPLEASALALVELSAAMIADELPVTRDLMEVVARRFNERFLYRWERVVEFLKLHYLLSRREDSAFWRDNRRTETIPERLREQLALWQCRAPSRRDFFEIEEIFPAASYQYVLYGMGFRPAPMDAPPSPAMVAEAEACFRQNTANLARFLAGLPSNRELISHVRQHGLPRPERQPAMA